MIVDLVAMPAVKLLHTGRPTELEHLNRRHELVEGRWHRTHLNLVDGYRTPAMQNRNAGWFTFTSDMTAAGISHTAFTERMFDQLRAALAAASGNTIGTLTAADPFHDLATCEPTRCVFLHAAAARTVASFDRHTITGEFAGEAARVARVFRHALNTSGLVELFAVPPTLTEPAAPLAVLEGTAAATR